MTIIKRNFGSRKIILKSLTKRVNRLEVRKIAVSVAALRCLERSQNKYLFTVISKENKSATTLPIIPTSINHNSDNSDFIPFGLFAIVHDYSKLLTDKHTFRVRVRL